MLRRFNHGNGTTTDLPDWNANLMATAFEQMPHTFLRALTHDQIAQVRSATVAM
jgi:hypothetical protein